MKDVIGNDLQKGDKVAIYLDPHKMGLCIGHVEDLREGGVNLAAGKGNNFRTPAQVRIILDITLSADPNLPVFPVLAKLANPDIQKKVEDMIDNLPRA